MSKDGPAESRVSMFIVSVPFVFYSLHTLGRGREQDVRHGRIESDRITPRSGQLGRVSLFLLLALFHLSL